MLTELETSEIYEQFLYKYLQSDDCLCDALVTGSSPDAKKPEIEHYMSKLSKYIVQIKNRTHDNPVLKSKLNEQLGQFISNNIITYCEILAEKEIEDIQNG